MKVKAEVDMELGSMYKTAFGCRDVWYWPEFRAFAERLVIALDKPTTAITLRIAMGEPVKIVHEYNGQNLTQPKE